MSCPRRVAFLTAYQDQNYAERYRARVSKVRAAEAGLHSEALTRRGTFAVQIDGLQG